MDKTNPPTSFGVFKPVGHIVVALESASQARAAASALAAQGFSPADMVHYTPQEMMDQVATEMVAASPLASLGQDLNLIKAHRTLAEEGCNFLVVLATTPDQVAQVTAVAKAMSAKSAQRYGLLIVEELVDTSPGHNQVFESPARGLDSAAADQGRP